MTKRIHLLVKMGSRCQQGAISGVMKKDIDSDDKANPPLVKTTSLYTERKKSLYIFHSQVGDQKPAVELSSIKINHQTLTAVSLLHTLQFSDSKKSFCPSNTISPSSVYQPSHSLAWFTVPLAISPWNSSTALLTQSSTHTYVLLEKQETERWTKRNTNDERELWRGRAVSA